jgi:hypothetical protein
LVWVVGAPPVGVKVIVTFTFSVPFLASFFRLLPSASPVCRADRPTENVASMAPTFSAQSHA